MAYYQLLMIKFTEKIKLQSQESLFSACSTITIPSFFAKAALHPFLDMLILNRFFGQGNCLITALAKPLNIQAN